MELRGLGLVDLAAGLGRQEIVTASVDVEAGEQSLRFNHRLHPEEARHGAFLGDKES